MGGGCNGWSVSSHELLEATILSITSLNFSNDLQTPILEEYTYDLTSLAENIVHL